jgi:NAD dependent epimerase/dehydratase
LGKIFVTGGDGFIGSHLVEALVLDGRDVKVLVQYNSLSSKGWLDELEPDLLNKLEVVAGDIRDFHSVLEAMDGCSNVLHLAALIAIPYSYKAPQSYVDTNITGTMNVLSAARAHGCVRVIHTSTSEVYGTAQSVPISESHRLLGQSPYSASKIAADQMAIAFHSSFDVPVVIARPFNTYGPRQSARAIIPTVIAQLSNGIEKLRVGAISPTRDMTYVSDTVSGFIALLDGEGGFGEVYNFGTGFEISIGDLITMIGEIMGKPFEIYQDSKRIRPARSEVERLLADNTKVRQKFGWEPSFSGKEGLRKGLSKTVEWFSDPHNLTRYQAGEYTI